MLRKPVRTADTPLVRAINEIGDGWMLLIVWTAGQQVRRFDEFQRELGVARNILAERLRRLVDSGLMEKTPINEGARRMEYRLTEKGAALNGALEALNAWGASWTRPASPSQTSVSAAE
ncbi:MAG: helix-turn-helix domain-containing protein [Pseudomonadota bacterium]